MTADAYGHPRCVLLLGGGSEIGLAITRRLVSRGAERVVLAGRDVTAMRVTGETLGAADVTCVKFDSTATEDHDRAVAEMFAGGDVDLAVLAFGKLGNAASLEFQPDLAVELAQVNYVGAVSVLLRIAGYFRSQGHGTVVVLSSVAGERVRRANFIYGSTKAALDGFSQGLGDALMGTGVRVLIVRPGFVRTAMTRGLPAPALATTADRVAEAVLRGLQRQSEIIWVPPVLRWVMAIVRHLPRPVFRRLRV